MFYCFQMWKWISNNDSKRTRGSNKDYLFPVFVEGGHCAHVLLYTGEMFTVQKTLSHAVFKISLLFFSSSFSQVFQRPCIRPHSKNTEVVEGKKRGETIMKHRHWHKFECSVSLTKNRKDHKTKTKKNLWNACEVILLQMFFFKMSSRLFWQLLEKTVFKKRKQKKEALFFFLR